MIQDKTLGDEFAVARTGANVPSREVDRWDICNAAEEAVQLIGRSPLIMFSGGNDGWWEAFSHGLAMPIQELGNKFVTAEEYVEIESDYLHWDVDGYDRKYGSGRRPFDRFTLSSSQLRGLAMRVITFMHVRDSLKLQGFELPENPEIQNAIEYVRSQFATNVKDLEKFAQLMRKQEPPRQLPGADHE